MYYKQLDGLRFYAVAGVMVAHWISWVSHNVILKSFHFGNGVMLFFVLSGFLITDILIKQKKRIISGTTTFGKELKNFYVRRTLRIFPIYYVLLLILYYYNYKNTHQIFPYLTTYSSNVLMAQTNDYLGDFVHFWSLAVEEQFYLFWPLFILLIPIKHLYKFIIFSIVFSLLSKAFYFIFLSDWWCAANYQTINVMYVLGAGALLAYLKNEKNKIFQKISNSYILTPVVFLFYLSTYYFIAYGNTNRYILVVCDDLMFTILAFVIIARAAGPGFSTFGNFILANKVCVHLGKISYAMYLFHMFAPEQCFKLFPKTKEELWLYSFLFTVVAAELSYWIVELPFNSLKKYFV